MVDVYCDEGVTGTNTKKREGFNCMVADALGGKIDLIITKSISRFARNTVDTLTGGSSIEG
ncbi:MAG: recombinase family protein [Eubacteriales bacterium]